MKTKISLLAILLGFMCLSNINAQSIDSKYGVDKDKTLLNASLYGEMVKQKNYEEALPGWRYVFANAPKFQKSTYSNGIKIMKGMYKKTKNKKYIDTLMMVYDQRIKYFGTDKKKPEGYLLGKKGGDLYTYKGKDIVFAKEAYLTMKKAIELQGTKISYTVLDKTMAATKQLVTAGEVDKLTVIDNYLEFMDNISTQLEYYRAKTQSAKNDKKIKALNITKNNIENNFIAAGVADCETLIRIFTPKFEANSEDIKLVNKIIKLLNRQDCVDSDLYAKLAEKKFELEPNADAAHNMARFFIKKKEFEKSKEYLNKAIELEVDASKKAGLHYKLANILLMQGKLSKAKSSALKAISNRQNWGKPYILIAKAYASYAPRYGSDKFDHSKVYWVVVDKLVKAKSVDAECAEEANKLINQYRPHYPNKNEAFMYSIKVGDRVTIGDWIGESTTVRF